MTTETTITADAPKRPSLRKSIDAKCKDCIYDSEAGTGGWRQQVDACTSYTCPLYPIRPQTPPPF